MKRHFVKKELSPDLQRQLAEALKMDDWGEMMDYLKENYPEPEAYSLDMSLLKAYSLVMTAISIHIDDVVELADEALLALKPFETDERAIQAIADIQKIRTKEIKVRNKVAKWADKDISVLTTEQKKNAAYQLSSGTDLPSLKKSAELFFSTYQDTGNRYYYCNYASLLYKSGQKEKALEEYQTILKFDEKLNLENHSMFISGIYEDLLDYHQDDKTKFKTTWEEAMNNSFIQDMPKNSTYVLFIFPLSIAGTESIFFKAYEYGFFEICRYIKDKIERDKQKTSKRLQEYLNQDF